MGLDRRYNPDLEASNRLEVVAEKRPRSEIPKNLVEMRKINASYKDLKKQMDYPF